MDSQLLHYPKRAKTYEELPSLIASWKRNMERWSARTGEKLAESTQREALMRMCPSELELDMRKHADKFDTLPKAERYIQTMVNHELEVKRNHRNVKPALNLEEEGTNIIEGENGELFAIYLKDDKKTIKPYKPVSGGPGKTGGPSYKSSKGGQTKMF